MVIFILTNFFFYCILLLELYVLANLIGYLVEMLILLIKREFSVFKAKIYRCNIDICIECCPKTKKNQDIIVFAILPSSMQWAVICCGCIDRSLLRLPPACAVGPIKCVCGQEGKSWGFMFLNPCRPACCMVTALNSGWGCLTYTPENRSRRLSDLATYLFICPLLIVHTGPRFIVLL